MSSYRPVVGFEGRYEVSDDGRVRGPRGHILKPIVKRGHLCVSLSKAGNHRWVHRLVLEAFVGPCPDGMQGRHFPDRDTTNNRLENLSWATPLVNQRDRDFHGTHNRRGIKVDDDMVRIIHATRSWPHGAMTALAREIGVSVTHIKRIIDRKARGYVR